MPTQSNALLDVHVPTPVLHARSPVRVGEVRDAFNLAALGMLVMTFWVREVAVAYLRSISSNLQLSSRFSFMSLM